MDDKIKSLLSGITWIGHASFRIENAGRVIYTDPWKLPAGIGGDGDFVLVTHDHYDHLSAPDIRKALKKGGKVIMPECCRLKFPTADRYVLPYTKLRYEGLDLYVTAAYNTDKSFHTREMGHVGYILDLDGVKAYQTGDCDAFPHMRDFSCDVVLLPVSGTYVMDPVTAVDAVRMLNPKVAIPMHYGDPDVVGSRADAERFKSLAPCEVVILDPLR
ncbi:MAG: MBL fold metallo-hydrolase [Calditrichaeota bacterium]|nr:MBL fold metallo-hydrolase [Calditrichota bacterium]